MSRQKEVKELRKWLRKKGIRIEKVRSGYYMAYAPLKKVRISATPSRSSWRRKALADLKRAGVDTSDWGK